MTTIRTTTTFEIRQRATAAIEHGAEYVFEAQCGERVKIGYVGGGGFVRVESREADLTLLQTCTLSSTKRDEALRIFDALVTDAARRRAPLTQDVQLDEYDRGVRHGAQGATIMAIGVLDGMLADAGLDDGVARVLRTARRELVSTLEDEED